MSKITEFISGVDDEYLIGLSNKGIVKRSYKDLETEHYEIKEQGETVTGQNGDIRVCLTLPLTDSTCSCPSSSVCKHVIMTILTARKLFSAGQTEADSIAERINQIPFADLKKNLTDKQWLQVLSEVQEAKNVRITYGSMVTVYMPSEDLTVKLSHPLSYSTCSVCHSDKLCMHKVFAILMMRMEMGVLTSESIREAASVKEERSSEDVPALLISLRSFLEEMLLVGSARLSPETPYGLERLAIRCHEAELASMEERLRSLTEKVTGYQGRKASVTTGVLLYHIMDCYRLMEQMERAIRGKRPLTPLAGEFRSRYMEMPELVLHGVGMRDFSGAAYDGKTLYFVEEKTGLFYTYTLVMPNIYDVSNKRRRVTGQVPWGLPCTLLQLREAKIRMRQGKANGERRLSSTSEAQAELIEIDGALPDGIAHLIFDDFALLWEEYLRRAECAGEREIRVGSGIESMAETDKVFLIRPNKILDMRYDETGQKLVFFLEDIQGHRLRGQLTYSKQEEGAIKSLERLAKNQKRDGSVLPVFVGALYVQDGECTLYPIETIREERLK